MITKMGEVKASHLRRGPAPAWSQVFVDVEANAKRMQAL
jgi:hypothetical protein